MIKSRHNHNITLCTATPNPAPAGRWRDHHSRRYIPQARPDGRFVVHERGGVRCSAFASGCAVLRFCYRQLSVFKWQPKRCTCRFWCTLRHFYDNGIVNAPSDCRSTLTSLFIENIYYPQELEACKGLGLSNIKGHSHYTPKFSLWE